RPPRQAHRARAQGGHHRALRGGRCGDPPPPDLGPADLQQPARRHPHHAARAGPRAPALAVLFSKIFRTGLVTEPLAGDEAALAVVRELAARTRRLLGRALAIREVDAGSCNGCELEISGLTGPVYDSERFGIHF